MLKKTLLTLVVVAGLFAAVAIPGAAAHSSVSATAKAAATANPTKSNCPPGTLGAGNYCEHFCVVPRMYGDSILKAIVLLNLADCKLGRSR